MPASGLFCSDGPESENKEKVYYDPLNTNPFIPTPRNLFLSV